MFVDFLIRKVLEMRSQPTVMLFPKVLVLLLMTVALAQVELWSKKNLLLYPL